MNARYRLNTHILAIDATDALTSIDDKILAVNIEIAKKLSLIESIKARNCECSECSFNKENFFY